MKKNLIVYYSMDGNTYGHILDPNTLSPVNNDLLSVTIVTSK